MIKTKYIIRILFFLLFVFPIFYWQEFYMHFYTYLTGTIITMVVKDAWQVVLASILVFGLFLIPLTYKKKAKWLDYSLVGAFFVSLFIEMYGIPLTILFASKYFFVPGTQLPPNVVEFKLLGAGLGMDHAMIYGTVLMIMGMLLILFGWWSLYRQAKRGVDFVQDGIYKYSRNPQYVGFILLILGWFYGWPTIITVIFSPILIYKYVRAAQTEERELIKQFSDKYRQYRQKVPFLL